MFFDLNAIGERLKKLRKDYFNLNQIGFSERLGIEQSYYSNLENGKKQLSYNMIEIISTRYNELNNQRLLNLNWLLLGVGELSMEDKRSVNIGVNNSNNTKIEVKDNFNETRNKSEQLESAVLLERIKGLEEQNKMLLDIIKSMTK